MRSNPGRLAQNAAADDYDHAAGSSRPLPAFRQQDQGPDRRAIGGGAGAAAIAGRCGIRSGSSRLDPQEHFVARNGFMKSSRRCAARELLGGQLVAADHDDRNATRQRIASSRRSASKPFMPGSTMSGRSGAQRIARDLGQFGIARLTLVAVPPACGAASPRSSASHQPPARTPSAAHVARPSSPAVGRPGRCRRLGFSRSCGQLVRRRIINPYRTISHSACKAVPPPATSLRRPSKMQTAPASIVSLLPR